MALILHPCLPLHTLAFCIHMIDMKEYEFPSFSKHNLFKITLLQVYLLGLHDIELVEAVVFTFTVFVSAFLDVAEFINLPSSL